jgi:hypothetical protein
VYGTASSAPTAAPPTHPAGGAYIPTPCVGMCATLSLPRPDCAIGRSAVVRSELLCSACIPSSLSETYSPVDVAHHISNCGRIKGILGRGGARPPLTRATVGRPKSPPWRLLQAVSAPARVAVLSWQNPAARSKNAPHQAARRVHASPRLA